MTRFEYYTQNLHEFAELLTDTYSADPYQDDSAWTIDGYDSCEEWLASEVGAKGEFSWQKNKKEKTPLDTYWERSLIEMTLRHVNEAMESLKICGGETEEFAPFKPLEVSEEHTCGAMSKSNTQCRKCCAYCDKYKCKRRCKNKPELCGQLDKKE